MKKNHKDKNPYEDIINLPHHVSDSRIPMPRSDRAGQFSSFAALTGYDGAIKETARLTEKRIELDETEKIVLDKKLEIVIDQIGSGMEIEVVFFEADKVKDGGAYISIKGIVKKIDKYENLIIMEDGSKIPIDEIFDMTGEMFRPMDDSFS